MAFHFADDFNVCCDESDKLMRQLKRKEESFHEERPRKAAVRSKELTSRIGQRPSKAKNLSPRKSKKKGKDSKVSKVLSLLLLEVCVLHYPGDCKF